jgi:hypothetical protein
MLESFTSLFLGPKVETPKPRAKSSKPSTDKVAKGNADKVRDPKGLKKPGATSGSARPVGRPRKNPVDTKAIKNSVGRPRKHPVDIKNIKKSVGRPRKFTEVPKSIPKEIKKKKTDKVSK